MSTTAHLVKPNFSETKPTMRPTAMLTMANHMSIGLLIAMMMLVRPPVSAPHHGPRMAAARMVPMVSRKIGSLNVVASKPPTMLMPIPTGTNTRAMYLFTPTPP